MAPPIVHGIFASAYTRSALLGLEEKDAAYEFVAMPFGTHKEQAHLARHPFGRIIVDWYFFPQVTVKISRERVIVPLRGGTPNEAVIAAALPQAETCLGAISRLMDNGPFLAGEHPTIADLMLAPQFDYFALTPESRPLLEPYPNMRDWLARMRARPSMQRTKPQ
jgi:glutathione S-transferase